MFSSSANSTGGIDDRRKKKKTSGGTGGEVDCTISDPSYNPATGLCSELAQECSYSNAAPAVEQLVSCVCLLCALSVVRMGAGVCVTRIYHRALPITLRFPAWEGPVFLVQYLALCESTVSMMAMSCGWWMALGIALFLLIPILILAFGHTFVRTHLAQQNLRFVQFKSYTFTELKRTWKMGQGCLGKVFACWIIYQTFLLRGEWNFDQFSGSALWSFLLEDYIGGFWFFAITRLLKQIALAAALGLADGALNAGSIIAIYFVDAVCVFWTRPHIQRDAVVIECLCSILNLLAALFLGLPVLFPELGPLFSDYLALFTSLAATFSTMMPVLLQILARLNYLDFLGVAKVGLIQFVCYLGQRAEEEKREHLHRKFMREVNEELKRLQFQLVLETPKNALLKSEEIKISSKSIGRQMSRRLGFSTSHYRCPMVSVRQAIAFVAGTNIYKVSILASAGPISSWNQEQYEAHALAFCMGQHVRLGSLCKFQGLDDKVLKMCLPVCSFAEERSKIRRTLSEARSQSESCQSSEQGINVRDDATALNLEPGCDRNNDVKADASGSKSLAKPAVQKRQSQVPETKVRYRL